MVMGKPRMDLCEESSDTEKEVTGGGQGADEAVFLLNSKDIWNESQTWCLKED